MRLDGACRCGLITRAAETDPQKATICRRTDRQTGHGLRVSRFDPGARRYGAEHGAEEVQLRASHSALHVDRESKFKAADAAVAAQG